MRSKGYLPCSDSGENIARENALAAYNVFPDSTLIQIARRKPRQPQQLEGISGIGEKRIERYGEAVCEVVAHWHSQERDKEFKLA